ncbi:DNA-processing protein DprA [Paradesulfitobacterium aromaticivorans]
MARSWNEEKAVRAAMRTIPGLGNARIRQLLEYYGSAQAAWEAPATSFDKFGGLAWIKEFLHGRARIDPHEIEKDLNQQNILTLIPEEKNYPALLAELSDAPVLLYYRGQLEPEAEALAIVGSRQATPYGKAAAIFLARELTLKGIVVISGLARGIDTAAHQGALEGKGVTWAFLGCGLDRIYPAENKRLAGQILDKGALLSEFPPGTPPDKPNFPARNRLISGCARGVVVVEAAAKSGALITADFALEQGREVFAVPGPIFSEMSRGTHHLLRQGAKIVEGLEDIVQEIAVWGGSYPLVDGSPMGTKEQGISQTSLATENLTPEQQIVMGLVSDVPLHIDELRANSALDASTAALILLELELMGKIIQLPGQYYALKRGI